MKEQITTSGAPAAIGAYSQGIKVGNLVFVSGQIPLDPETNTFPEGIAAQTERSLLNCKAVLEAAGSSMDKAVKVGVFIKDMNNFAAMNEVYSKFFSAPYPARFAVEVARLPKDVMVEIDVIAEV